MAGDWHRRWSRKVVQSLQLGTKLKLLGPAIGIYATYPFVNAPFGGASLFSEGGGFGGFK